MLELYLRKPTELELRQMENLPSPQGDEVKIKTTYGGICGSDLSVYKGKLEHAAYPLRPGHELVGTIIEAGEQALYSPGTRVVIMPNTFCGECQRCAAGQFNLCIRKKSLGVNVNGGFSEQFVISSKFVYPLPDDLPDERAVLIEPLAVVVHAFSKVQITQDTTVAIVGSGNEGMMSAALATYLGAKVTAIDINPRKHELIRKLGGIRAAFPEDIKNEHFDVVVEAAGVPGSFEKSMELVRPGGSLILIGFTPEVWFPATHIVRNEISVFGSIIYIFPQDFEQAIRYLRDPKFFIDPIISQIVPLSEYRQAYDNALSGNYGKIVFKF